MSEEATFVWKNDDDIILLCVHLDYNAGILERKQFSKASVPRHMLLSYGNKAFALPRRRSIAPPAGDGWVGWVS